MLVSSFHLISSPFCAQHNPTLIAQKKASKDAKVCSDLAALTPGSRIRLRTSSGVFELSLVVVNAQKSTLTVLWDNGTHRGFKWGSIVWGVSGEGTMVGRKPTAEGT
ncbi:hypothetical protein M422DRAFT_174852 [Sphaerobolus stellatus SS14]|uniref:Uncharacterized protein n=1 Tax=Sphaerobolus stellatus (strain SS14) TaxID=990650 RepID=A0A0C9VNM6_SPHS4|nr:hypothetical protein M422DRAFT_174852 [Sphaerobolus stellatus SS14]